jgi:hypothetical protein
MQPELLFEHRLAERLAMTIGELRRGRGSGPMTLGEYHSWIAATIAERALAEEQRGRSG